MVKIIIVEDDEKMQQKIKEVVSKAFFSIDLEFEIRLFKKYDINLEKIIKDNSEKKLFLLDIELNTSVSGINIANMIREDDWESEIIFLTNHDKMFEQVYRTIYKVFDFIEKYYDFEKRLNRDLCKIINKNYDNKMVTFYNKKITLQLHYKDITYITRDTKERKLVIYTTNNRFFVSMSIQDCLKMLDSRFSLIHRACIVNKERVNEYNWSKGFFILDNKEKIYLLSKRYKKAVDDNAS